MLTSNEVKVHVEHSETGCSSGEERALWEREAAGSIPVTPTKPLDKVS